LPAAGSALLRAVEWELDDEDAPDYSRQFAFLRDEAQEGPVRAEIHQRLQHLVTHHPLWHPL